MKLTNHELLILINLTENELEFLRKVDNKLLGKTIMDSKIFEMYKLNKKLSDELDERGDVND